MAGRKWTDEEAKFVKKNYVAGMTCEEIAQKIDRTTRSVQHFVGYTDLEKPRAKVGDIIKGWTITDIYCKQIDSQQVSVAVIKSTVDDSIKHVRLTKLTTGKISEAGSKNQGRWATHGLSNHPLYMVWHGIKNRCYNKNQKSYQNYGARGIKMCKEWKEDFKTFYDWAIEAGWQVGLQIDRTNNDVGYEPSNCRMSTRKENVDNRSISVMITAFGETKNASDWSLDDRCKCSYNSLIYRINKGWDHEKAITTKSRSRDNFRRYKSLYQYVQANHPEIIKKFNKEQQ